MPKMRVIQVAKKAVRSSCSSGSFRAPGRGEVRMKVQVRSLSQRQHRQGGPGSFGALPIVPGHEIAATCGRNHCQSALRPHAASTLYLTGYDVGL